MRGLLDMRIAIVGAGVAGLTAAHRLRQKGYSNITLYECEAAVGGKVCSYLHRGRVYELGALWSSPRYRASNALAKSVGATTRGAPLPDVLEAGTLRNYAAYMRRHFRAAELVAAFARLAGALVIYPSPGTGAPDSFERFAHREGFGPIERVSRSFFSGCGYLQNDVVPAPYLMKLMHIFIDVLVLDVLGLSRSRMRVFQDGWQDLWRKLASKFEVRHSCRIASVRRYDDHGSPRVEISDGAGSETYDRLIVASPLDTSGAFLDLREEERGLFSRIRTHRFRVTLVEGENLPHASLMDHATREKTGHVNLIVRQHADADVFSVYQQLDEAMSEERATALMCEDATAMGGTISRVITSRTWRYFPHVSSDDIRDGFYARLDRLQGVRGTFYVGSVMSLETVEHTARFSAELIDRKF